jgi:hypothetical protein
MDPDLQRGVETLWEMMRSERQEMFAIRMRADLEEKDNAVLRERLTNLEHENLLLTTQSRMYEQENASLREQLTKASEENAKLDAFWRARFERLKAKMHRTDELMEKHVSIELNRIIDKAKKVSKPRRKSPPRSRSPPPPPCTRSPSPSAPRVFAKQEPHPLAEDTEEQAQDEAVPEVVRVRNGWSVRKEIVTWFRKRNGDRFSLDEGRARFVKYLCEQPDGTIDFWGLKNYESLNGGQVQLESIKKHRIVINEPYSGRWKVSPLGRMVNDIIKKEGIFV